MNTYPSTARFVASKDPARLNIRGEKDRILDIWYCPAPGAERRHFGHTWDIQDSHPLMQDVNGKWTFNRSDVAIENKWWPAIYQHDTLAALLDHLEATFVEGVPANQPD
jgi:hypothetical protein